MQTLRAIFILCFAGATTFASAEQITCESHQDSVEACTTLLAGSHVRLAKQLSETRCVEGQNWGIDTQRNSLWISKGCRAVFDIKAPRNAPSEPERPPNN